MTAVVNMIDRKEGGVILEGLAEIHKERWIHRNITSINILYYPSESRVALCGFGKLSFQLTHTDTVIANWI